MHLGHGICSLYTWGIISFLLVIFVWFKAEDYGMDPVLWAVAVFFFGPVAFGVFLILALSQTKTLKGENKSYSSTSSYPSHFEKVHDEPSSDTTRYDPDFRDEHLDNLISNSEFSKARTYLSEMIKVAREALDEGAVRNYSQYSPRINNAAMEAEKRKRQGI